MLDSLCIKWRHSRIFDQPLSQSHGFQSFYDIVFPWYLQDTELLELRQTIELLRKQSIEAGLAVASLTAGENSILFP